MKRAVRGAAPGDGGGVQHRVVEQRVRDRDAPVSVRLEQAPGEQVVEGRVHVHLLAAGEDVRGDRREDDGPRPAAGHGPEDERRRAVQRRHD